MFKLSSIATIVLVCLATSAHVQVLHAADAAVSTSTDATAAAAATANAVSTPALRGLAAQVADAEQGEQLDTPLMDAEGRILKCCI